MNNLCTPLFMNNMNMDPSLNLIFKYHVLASLFYSTYIQPVDFYEMELCSIVLFLFVYALFSFSSSSISSIFGVLGIMFRLVIWIVVLLRELCIKVFGRHCPIVYLVS